MYGHSVCNHHPKNDYTNTILSTVPPKRMNSASIEINIYWSKMMFEYFPKTQTDASIPHLLIYALKTKTESVNIGDYINLFHTKNGKMNTVSSYLHYYLYIYKEHA